jgi:hypothetical protein
VTHTTTRPEEIHRTVSTRLHAHATSTLMVHVVEIPRRASRPDAMPIDRSRPGGRNALHARRPHPRH